MEHIETYRGYHISRDPHGRGYRVTTKTMFVEAWFTSVDQARASIDEMWRVEWQTPPNPTASAHHTIGA